MEMFHLCKHDFAHLSERFLSFLVGSTTRTARQKEWKQFLFGVRQTLEKGLDDMIVVVVVVHLMNTRITHFYNNLVCLLTVLLDVLDLLGEYGGDENINADDERSMNRA
jgi:hypothetical protein